MHVLLIEDEVDFIEELKKILDEIPYKINSKTARNLKSAESLIQKHFFDLVVLDLNIPTCKGALDASPIHGLAIFENCRANFPGTPIFVLTGSFAEGFIPQLLKHQQRVDIWGAGNKVGMVDFLKKHQLDEFQPKLTGLAEQISGLNESVELNRNNIDLTLQEDRQIRIFCRRFDAKHCVVSRISGGMSCAKVFKIELKDKWGVNRLNAVAKLGPHKLIRNEGENFEKYISLLEPSATPRILAMQEYGAGNCAGIFFQLESNYELSLFDMALNQKKHVSNLINCTYEFTKPWSSGVPHTLRKIRKIRRRVLNDDLFQDLCRKHQLNWVGELEKVKIQVNWACIHGDLHGKNVLVSEQNTVVLIDYGDVGGGPVSLDPISLELSILFHPSQGDLGAWPSKKQAKMWGVIEEYSKGCPAIEYIKACRAWANKVAAGKREITASAYSYLIRQLKYDDTNVELTMALLEGVKSFYDTT